MSDSRIRVLIVEDHTIVREGIRSLLEVQSDIEVVGEAAEGGQAIAAAEKFKPDVVLMDISMPDISGVEATRKIKQNDSAVKVLALTMYESDEYFYKMLSVGASGYFVKGGSSLELLSAVRAVWQGQVYFHPTVAKKLVGDYLKRDEPEPGSDSYDLLSGREREVIKLIAEGHSSQEIAELLTISPVTVQNHRAQVMKKLDLVNLTELVRYAVRRGLTTVDS